MLIKKYLINNDCIKQLQNCCDEHYQTCEDFTEEDRQSYVKIFDWLEKLKSTNEIVIHYVDKLPDNADTEKDIYVLANKWTSVHNRTEHNIFNDVLSYFGQYEMPWDKKIPKDKLKNYGWSSRKSLLDSFKLWETLEIGRPISRSSGYVSDLENWTSSGSLKETIYHTMTT
tara:strand:- start:472 stop:984 length:513 start_codon:yes stop_codon:yes gene_type:complete